MSWKTPVILLQRPGSVNQRRQVAACMPYAEAHGYAIEHLVSNESDALALVRLGEARVVIAAFVAAGDERLRAQLADLGAALEYCREEHRDVARIVDVETLIVGLAQRAVSPDQIGEILNVPVAQVRRILAANGLPAPGNGAQPG